MDVHEAGRDRETFRVDLGGTTAKQSLLDGNYPISANAYIELAAIGSGTVEDGAPAKDEVELRWLRSHAPCSGDGGRRSGAPGDE